jgi:hypothetical protein
MKPLNIFYSEPDPDRWVKFDRYPRRLIRRLMRGKTRPGGVAMVVINLMKGLDRLGVPYRLNDYRYIRKHSDEVACIVGKPHVLFERKWGNPIVFGAGIYSHPVDYLDLLTKYPGIKRVLVPGEWMRQMFEPYYGDKVSAWPTGIDTDEWKPTTGSKNIDFLIYDKVRWEHDKYKDELISPIIKILNDNQLSNLYIKYGSYIPAELKEKVNQCKAAIFLCEHETQGLAYQQILTTNTPILAWDRGGYWQDPDYYPKRVKYRSVSSVPYWDERCGSKFTDINDFAQNLTAFLNQLNTFKPRDYILENLTLEKCAEEYIRIVQNIN